MRLGHRRVDVDDPSAALAHEVMMRAGVGVEARVGTGQFLEQPRADEYPEIAVNRAQARAGQAAANESMDLFGGRMGFGAPDHLEHRVTGTGEADKPVPQGSLRATTRASPTPGPPVFPKTISITRPLARQAHATGALPRVRDVSARQTARADVPVTPRFGGVAQHVVGAAASSRSRGRGGRA